MSYERPQVRRFGTIRDLTRQQAGGAPTSPTWIAINPVMPVLYGVPTAS